MAKAVINPRNVRKLLRLGKSSLVISLPVDFLRELRWKEKQKVMVKRSGKKLVIEDWRKR